MLRRTRIARSTSATDRSRTTSGALPSPHFATAYHEDAKNHEDHETLCNGDRVLRELRVFVMYRLLNQTAAKCPAETSRSAASRLTSEGSSTMRCSGASGSGIGIADSSARV